MKRILLPLEETERSLKALIKLKQEYSPGEVDVVLLMVDEKVDYATNKEVSEQAIINLNQKLDLVASALEGYKVIKKADLGKAGQKIILCAKEYGVDMIMMTKSAQDDMHYLLGKTTEYVLTRANCDVVIVSEREGNDREYRGLVYRKAESVVNLRGQLSQKQSECLIPSVSADCIYHIEVVRGRIRFIHKSYNPETRNWDLPPANGEDEAFDIMAGMSVDIPVKAHSVDGKADRLRIVNRNLKTEAVFNYKITANTKSDKQ